MGRIGTNPSFIGVACSVIAAGIVGLIVLAVARRLVNPKAYVLIWALDQNASRWPVGVTSPRLSANLPAMRGGARGHSDRSTRIGVGRYCIAEEVTPPMPTGPTCRRREHRGAGSRLDAANYRSTVSAVRHAENRSDDSWSQLAFAPARPLKPMSVLSPKAMASSNESAPFTAPV